MVALGSRTAVFYGVQTALDESVTPTKRLALLLSEGITREVGNLVSASLRDDRAIGDKFQGTEATGGPVNYEQSTEGQLLFFEHALGHVKTLTSVDGGVKTLAKVDHPIGTISIQCDRTADIDDFPSSGGVAYTYIDSSGNMQVANYSYSSRTENQFNLDSTLAEAHETGDFVMLRDATAYSGVYTHIFRAFKNIPTAGMTLEIKRDIVVFKYIGTKVNTLSETFNATEILTGTFELIAKKEWCGSTITAQVMIGDSTIDVKSTDIGEWPTSGTNYLMLGTEKDITYTGVDTGANQLTGVSGIDADHLYDSVRPLPVALQERASEPSEPTAEALTSFMAAVYINAQSEEVLNANYTVNNNIMGDKFALGSRTPVELPEQRRGIEGSINVEFDDMRNYRDYIDGRSVELEIRATSDLDSGEILSTGVYRSKTVMFHKIKYSGTTPVAGDEGVIMHDMPFNALPDNARNLPEMHMIIVSSEEDLT